MPLYAYNLEKAIDKFWQVKEVTNLPTSTWFLLYGSMLTHGILIEWSKYLKKISKERILGEPLVHQPYLTYIMHNPYGNLPISTWFLLNGSILTHGILIEWPKYLKKISKERYFRRAISTPTISHLYNA
jgi:hypothetical protein